ncbi:hypothetical protein BD779DRAFT_223256 [Infundibulicybe gibba]|nr:hypothetical protein BD779DRAFT_223256 [Infundibulicybe gibba]
MGTEVHLQYTRPEKPVGSTSPSSSQVWDKNLLAANRAKELPALESPSFWRRKKVVAIGIGILIFVLVAALVVGLVVGLTGKKHHVDQASTTSGTAPLASSPIPTASTALAPSSSSSSAPTPIATQQPVPATLATAFQSSSWIWLGAQALTGVPAGDWAFRKTLPTSTAPAREAVALLTADNGFLLYHNGQLIAADTNTVEGWKLATAVHVDLDPSSNVFAIQARNFPSDTDPNGNSSAGLLASVQITYADGSTAIMSTDASWHAAQPVPGGFQAASFDDSKWQSAAVLAKYGDGPWAAQVAIPQSYNITAR